MNNILVNYIIQIKAISKKNVLQSSIPVLKQAIPKYHVHGDIQLSWRQTPKKILLRSLLGVMN